MGRFCPSLGLKSDAVIPRDDLATLRRPTTTRLDKKYPRGYQG